MKKTFLFLFCLFFGVFVLAWPFGLFVDKYFFNVNGGFGTFSLSDFFILDGLPMSYMFIVPILFYAFKINRKKVWITIISLPILFLCYLISIEFLICAVSFFIAGIGVVYLLTRYNRRYCVDN